MPLRPPHGGVFAIPQMHPQPVPMPVPMPEDKFFHVAGPHSYLQQYAQSPALSHYALSYLQAQHKSHKAAHKAAPVASSTTAPSASAASSSSSTTTTTTAATAATTSSAAATASSTSPATLQRHYAVAPHSAVHDPMALAALAAHPMQSVASSVGSVALQQAEMMERLGNNP